jgi:predicted transcriptional regulator
LRWATRITSSLGSAFGVILVILGAITFIAGNFIGGMWWFLIGMFLRNAAQMSYRHLMVRQVLEGEPVQRFMQEDIDVVPPETSISTFLENYVYKYQHKMFPVQQGDHVIGCASTKGIKSIPQEQRETTTVADIMQRCSSETTVDPDDDAMKIFARMARSGNSRFLVMDGERLVGMVTLKDLMGFIALKLDLEEDVKLQEPSPPAVAA